MSIGIVTDSACDVLPDLVERYHIRVIPVYINFGAQESYLDDGVQITKLGFYQRLPSANPLPTTAAPSVGEAEAALRQALEQYEHVIAIHIGHNVSGTIGSSRVAAQSIGGERITVFDTGSLSMGAGWQVLIAAELASQGADLVTILRTLESAKQRTRLWAVPNTMDYLRRSGRVSSLVAGLGELLDIKPIIRASQNEVQSEGRVRTFKKVIPKLVELAEAQGPLERLAILHINNLPGAEELRLALQHLSPPEYTQVTFAAAAIGANFGPGGLGLVTVKQAK